MQFGERLTARVRQVGSPTCVGLDPHLGRIPPSVFDGEGREALAAGADAEEIEVDLALHREERQRDEDDLMAKGSEIGDFEPTWWQRAGPWEQDARLRAAGKRWSPSEEAVVASCAAAKTAIFNGAAPPARSARPRSPL